MHQVLSPEDIQHYQEHGYVRLAEAFPPDTTRKALELVWDLLEKRYGYDRRDPETWHGPTGGLNKRLRANADLWGTADSRLASAVTQLLGPDWKVPRHWGTLLFSVPDHATAPWNVPTGWHWDCDPFKILNGKEGVFIFSFLSQVKPCGGGTLIVDGSPELVLRHHRGLSPGGGTHKAFRESFFKTHPWLVDLHSNTGSPESRIHRLMHQTTDIDGIAVRVVELTGEPGDAVLCHPAILHVASQNLAEVPRFMRAKRIWCDE